MKVVERFMQFVDKSKGIGPFGNCWIWKGSIDKEGYGRFAHSGKNNLAHRISYRIANKTIPHGKLVLHECDVRNCVNPSHLYPGTDQDNTNDKMKRGRDRYCSGEKNPHSKLTEKEVLKIRELRAKGYNGHYLAKVYNVTPGAIYHASNGRSWKHVHHKNLQIGALSPKTSKEK